MLQSLSLNSFACDGIRVINTAFYISQKRSGKTEINNADLLKGMALYGDSRGSRILRERPFNPPIIFPEEFDPNSPDAWLQFDFKSCFDANALFTISESAFYARQAGKHLIDTDDILLSILSKKDNLSHSFQSADELPLDSMGIHTESLRNEIISGIRTYCRN